MHHAHAAPAAAHRGLDDDGIADFAAIFCASLADLTGSSVPGSTGTPAEAASLRAAVLSPSSSSSSGVGPMKVIPAFSQARANAGFSDKKSVTRMDRVDALLFGERHDSRDVQVRFDWSLADANLVGFIGLEPVQAQPVFLRINADRAQAEFGGRAKDADGDLAAVGGEQFLDRFGLLHQGSDRTRPSQNFRLFHERA